MIMVAVQVADLSHENFKSSHEAVTESTFKSFWSEIKSWTQTQVTLRSSLCISVCLLDESEFDR